MAVGRGRVCTVVDSARDGLAPHKEPNPALTAGRSANWSVQDAEIPTQLATYHRLEQPGERVGVEEVSVGACSVAIHRYATSGSRDVPGLAAAPLERDRPQVGLFDVTAEHDHAVGGEQTDVAVADRGGQRTSVAGII